MIIINLAIVFKKAVYIQIILIIRDLSQYYHIHQMQHIEKIKFQPHLLDANSQI